ncbi:hypothetical protein DEA06_05385 [Microbacterium sp. Gd 4-13]|uniref:DUF6049 family protein n=1 Tax=Microbacterium sp. Gd 4-13 TaxID=2173179 RepID=UPI000D56A5D3|nr:DUF6049 family protein [Microbacterium sp. Gd 4-13]PVW05193.1 hypothetical protein DEA06_05385 [Microbacterium sp. Gd 4-13]
MIETPHVPRVRASRRRPLRRLAATGAILAILLGGAAPAFAAATPEPAATAAPAPALTLVPADNGVLTPGADLAVTVSLTAGGGPSTVSLAIGTQPLADRAALTRWSAGERDGVAVADVGSVAIDAQGTPGAASAPIRVAAANPTLLGRPAGVYPIVATTTTASGATLVSTSAVVILGPRAPVSIGVVVPITGPAISRGLLTSDALAELTAADGDLTAQLDAVAGTTAILAVDPAIPAAIRVLGDAAPGTARDWLDRLMNLPNSRFALQFGDADLATQVQAGLTEPLSTLPLVSYLPEGTGPDTAPPTPSPTGTPTADPTNPVPDPATLTDIGDARSNVYWPATGSAGTAVVSTLGALGTAEEPAMTLIPSSGTSAGADGTRIGARVDSAASALLAYDSTISDLLRQASSAGDAAQRDASLAEVTAQLAFVDSSTPLLVTVDRGQDRSRGSLRAAILAASGAPGAVPVGLDEIVASPASASVDVTEVPADEVRVADLTALLADEATLTRFATILDDPALLTGRERAEILQLLGIAWRADAAAAQTSVAEHKAATLTTLDSVGILASDVNLLSYDADYPPYVRNALPWPINVTLIVEPNDPRLIMQTRTDATSVPGDSITRVAVPIEAQIANGTVTVDMRLVSPTGEPIGAPTSIAVEVHADWENIGLGILGGLLVVFVGVGIIRTVRRRRRAAHIAAAVDETPGETE